jgi:hypothetical protein
MVPLLVSSFTGRGGRQLRPKSDLDKVARKLEDETVLAHVVLDELADTELVGSVRVMSNPADSFVVPLPVFQVLILANGYLEWLVIEVAHFG